MDKEPARALTIAGSDSGAAAGLQADIKTFTALGVYCTSVVTVVTAQNTVGVDALYPLPAPFVGAQLEAVLADYGAEAAKTGYIGSTPLIQHVAAAIEQYAISRLVVDPVLVNHRGEAMFPPEVTAAYRTYLAPLALLLTPNAAEAALLAEQPVRSLAEGRRAAHLIQAQGVQAVLITGILAGGAIVDLLLTDQLRELSSPRIDTTNTHGSGDTLSAAITAFLAQGYELLPAVAKARAFTRTAMQRAVDWRLGAGHGPLSHFPSQ